MKEFTPGQQTLGGPIKNTIKQVDQNSLVEKTFDRSLLYEIYTPQLLKREFLEKDLEVTKKQKLTMMLP
ncbi:MAG: 2-C-methyl-D-erythritol 4-phosphate cytidylyltransferase [Candidatus Neptunochlamydia sp.]|nr:2-C-methyl-D-erythritol 4-phosphate cytidylyltransferase [Candidatus Neptunochlamydia sp.]